MTSKKKDKAEPEVLRILPDENAFYFYKAIGKPLGIRANSLAEFSNKMKEVDATSIKFHAERHDFENWIKLLGDSTLVEQIASLSIQSQTPEKLQADLSRVVAKRLNSFRKPAS